MGENRQYFWEPPEFDRTKTIQELTRLHVPVQQATVSSTKYGKYLDAAMQTGIYDGYANHFGSHFQRKALEHFTSFELMQISRDDAYMDVASSGSVVPEILQALYELREPWRQDLAYPPGVHGHKVGSNATNIPLPDGTLTKMALHCSFEHFEADADSGFIQEGARLLCRGGLICIVPLYMSNVYHILSSLELIEKLGMPDFEPDTPILWSARPNNHHGRMYDPVALKRRVINVAFDAGLHPAVVDVSFEPRCLGIGTNLALMLRKVS